MRCSLLQAELGFIHALEHVLPGNREIEGRALIDCTFCPHLASVTVNDALNRCKTYASTFKRIHMMQALKHTKQLIYVFHIKPGAVVSYEYHDFITISVEAPYLDLRFRLRASKLHSI